MSYKENDQTNDDIRGAAAAALADVDALKCRGEDRRILLNALVKARLSFIAASPSLESRTTKPAKAIVDPRPTATTDGDILDKLSTILSMSRDTLELVYAADENSEPHIVISPKRISTNKARAARQLAQLAVAGRQLTGVEEWTSAGMIRKVVTDYGRLDNGNFASTLQQLDGIAVSRGKGQSRELKITRPGIESTTDLIRSLIGVEA